MNKQILKTLLFLFALSPFFSPFGQVVAAQEQSAGTDIVLIDPSLPDMDVLTGALKPGTKLIYLDGLTPIINSIGRALRDNAPVKSLHIVTHGSPGAVFTTSSFLNEQMLIDQHAEISIWKSSFTSDAEIMLYGCNIGKGAEGVSFCNKLSDITGAKVSASDDPTGASANGGDWDLEVSTGSVGNKSCFTSAIQYYNFLLYKVLTWSGSSFSTFAIPVTNFYNSLSGHSAVQMTDGNTSMPDLSDYALVFVILPGRALNSTEISNLKAHLDKGGRIVWVGEHSGFATQNSIITTAVSALGGHLSIQNLAADNGCDYLPNTHINMSSDLMEGVTKLRAGTASAVNIGGDATVLVKMNDYPAKISMAQERIGNGDIVAWADVEAYMWGILTNTSYGTGTLFTNFLTKAGARKESMLVASLTTTEAYSVSGNSAISGGNITNDNGFTITQRGICWSTSNVSPTTSDSKVLASSGGTGSFTGKMAGLSLGTKYYARAFAISSKGTAYGNTISFTTPSVANTAPSAVADNFSCQRGGSFSGNVMSNDFDDDGNAMTAIIVTAPSYNSGAFTLNANGSFTYTSNGSSAPADFFSYYLTDGISNSATVGVSIALYTANNLPVGANEAITVKVNEDFSFSTADFTFSDADAGHTFNGIKIVTLPAKGVLKYNGLPIAAGAICNDVTKLTFNTNGASGESALTSFTYKVVASSAEESAASYTMTINAEVVKTAVAVTLSGLTQTYTGLPLAATATTDPAGLTVDITYDGSSTIPTNAGAYAVVATVNDATYKGTTTGSLVIGKAMLTATAAAQTKVYGAANPTLTFSYSGWKNSDTETVLDTKPNISTTVTPTTSAGVQSGAITLSGGSDNNYDFTYVPADFTVTKAMLTATAAAQTKVYGAANPALTFSYSGWKNSDTETVLDTKPNISTTVTPTTSAGVQSGAITLSGGSDNNYDFTYVPADFTVTKAMLTATAAAQTKVYGAANPALTFSYSGWKNSDTETVLDTKPNISTTVTPTTSAGVQSGAITLNGGSDNNYDFTYVPADFTVTKAMLTATAAAQTKVYGAANPALTFSYTGWKNSDTETVLDTKPNISTTVTPTTSAGVQSGAITLNGGSDNNYDFTYVPADFTVTKAMLTATAAAQTKVYGAANPALTFSYSGWKNSDTETVLDTKPNISTTVTPTTSAGVQSGAITLNGGSDNNYDFTYVPADFTVTKAMLTATAAAQTKVYGAANPALTFSYSGWKNSDTETVLDTKPNISTTVTPTTSAGVQTGAITLSGGSDNNYDFTYVPADFTVTKAMLTATAAAQTKVYGAANPALTFSYTGWKNSDTETVLDTKPNISTTVTPTTSAGVQTGAITLSGGSDNNYDFTYVPADFTVTKAMLTATAAAQTKVYGAANPTQTFSYSGWKNSDTETVLDTKPNISTTVTPTTSAGVQSGAITLNGGSDNNYDFTYVPADFTVTKAMLTATAAAQTKVYGAANPALTFSYTGWKNSDTETVLDTKPNISTTVTPTTSAGVQSGAITLSGGSDNNYDFTYVPADFTVTKAMLTATAAAQTKVYGAANPALTFSYSGWKNSDTETVLDTKPNISTTVTPTTSAGVQSGAITLSGGSDNNYDFTYVPADFTVTKAMLIVTGVKVQDKVYDGNTDAKITYTELSGVVGSDDVAIDKSITGTFARAGVGTDIDVIPSVNIVGTDITNYALLQLTGLKADITPKELTVSAVVAKNKVYDGTTVATLENAALVGVVGTENVILSNAVTGTFAQAGIGTDIAVTPSMTLSGIGIGNYTLTQPTGLKANITTKELTVSAAVARNKVYDGTTAAVIDNARLEGVVGTENVVLSNATTGTFIQASTGLGIGVIPAMTITGSGISNYTLTQPVGLKADIIAKQAEVTPPVITESKVYDGSQDAEVIAGFMSNLAPGDAGKVFITATAVYSDQNAGDNRTITITYTLSGPAAENYKAPASYVYSVPNIKITPKQLTISDPLVVTNKMVDGKTGAVLTAIGSLHGVESIDADKISVTATVNYDNANVGSNKTITVVYSISGSSRDNYIAPVNHLITGAKISGYVTLNPMVTSTPGCEESNLDLAYSLMTGTPTQYKITFGETALAAGIQNVSYTNLPTADVDGLLPVSIPKGVPDGIYQGTLQLRNELGSESPVYPFQFTINLSTDFIVSKFDDVILCDNSSNRFTSYQWYKDGEVIEGATKQFYCDPAGLVGSYFLKVTTTDGKTLYSCPKAFNTPSTKSVIVSPNPLKTNQSCTVKVTGFQEEELENAVLSVFDMNGLRVYHSSKVSQSNSMRLPAVPGIYIGHVTTANEAKYVFKVVVEK